MNLRNSNFWPCASENVDKNTDKCPTIAKKYPYLQRGNFGSLKGGCRSIEFVGWCTVGWRDERSSCNASQSPRFPVLSTDIIIPKFNELFLMLFVRLLKLLSMAKCH